MNEAAAARIDAHMGKLVPRDTKENQIPRLQIGKLHSLALPILVSGRARSAYARFAVTVVNQTTAVEPARSGATISVGTTDHVAGDDKSRVRFWHGSFRFDSGFGTGPLMSAGDGSAAGRSRKCDQENG